MKVTINQKNAISKERARKKKARKWKAKQVQKMEHIDEDDIIKLHKNVPTVANAKKLKVKCIMETKRNRLFEPITRLKHPEPTPSTSASSLKESKRTKKRKIEGALAKSGPSRTSTTEVQETVKHNEISKIKQETAMSEESVDLVDISIPMDSFEETERGDDKIKRMLPRVCKTKAGEFTRKSAIRENKKAPITNEDISAQCAEQSPIYKAIDSTLTETSNGTSKLDQPSSMPKIVFHMPPVLDSADGKEKLAPFFTNKYVFSNHFPCPGLKIDGMIFSCTEQYYMWGKAMFFGNNAAAEAIQMATDPKQMKLIGSSLDNFDEDQWKIISWEIMLEANLAKYKQFSALRYQLFRTIGCVLIEASPTDKWWGVGLSIDSPDIIDSSKWRGANVMGEILMTIRTRLAEKEEHSQEVELAMDNLIADLC